MNFPVEAYIGRDISRVDGRAKVTGKADYSSDYSFPNMAWGYVVKSTIAKGTVTAIDSQDAEKTPGFLKIYTAQNRPPLYFEKKNQSKGMPTGEDLLALSSNEIHYYGQTIALVLAETYEQAREAASRVRVTYQEAQPIASMEPATFRNPKKVDGKAPHLEHKADGISNVMDEWNKSEVKLDATYETAILHHHPMEPHSAVAVWDQDRLTCYTPSQWVIGFRNFLNQGLGVSEDKVRVISHYLGGGFGCKGSAWMFLLLTAMAAKDSGRPVKYVMEREHMFTSVGFRPTTTQRLMLGAKHDGTLTAIRHLSANNVSFVGEFIEATGHRASYVLYPCPAIELDQQVYDFNTGSPCQMRAPGDSPGMFALETAMDELAVALSLDPVALRLKNMADRHPFENVPFSSKNLTECLQVGSDKFGWTKRNPQPRSQPEGDWLIGWGMATSLYPANRMDTQARVRILDNGTAEVSSATQDLGTGTYTIMAQMAAQELALPIEKIKVELGESTLPKAGVSGGSMSAASVLPAVQKAARAALDNLIDLALEAKLSVFHDLKAEDLVPVNGALQARTQPARQQTYSAILKQLGKAAVDNTDAAKPGSDKKPSDESNSTPKSAFYSFGAYFAEVAVQALTCETRVRRVLAVMDIGQPLNLKTARSQILGGAIFGIGAALTEHSILDPASARWITQDLGTYHIPVQADTPEIEVIFAGKPDYAFNDLGARGVGEIGNTGLAAALGNAIYHATGTRLRSLPFTPDKLLNASVHAGNTADR